MSQGTLKSLNLLVHRIMLRLFNFQRCEFDVLIAFLGDVRLCQNHAITVRKSNRTWLSAFDVLMP